MHARIHGGIFTKQRREREIPIRTDLQRAVFNEAKLLAGKGSPIPEEMSYVEQLQRFKAQCTKAHIRRVHGLRHAYAEQRYREQPTQWWRHERRPQGRN